jgi:plasmid stabilization system protein ParE
MKQLLYSARARKDLRKILEKIREDKPRAATSFVDRLEAHARILERFPKAGAQCGDLIEGLRVLSHRGYAVYYRIHDDSVTVEPVIAPGLDVNRDLFR